MSSEVAGGCLQEAFEGSLHLFRAEREAVGWNRAGVAVDLSAVAGASWVRLRARLIFPQLSRHNWKPSTKAFLALWELVRRDKRRHVHWVLDSLCVCTPFGEASWRPMEESTVFTRSSVPHSFLKIFPGMNETNCRSCSICLCTGPGLARLPGNKQGGSGRCLLQLVVWNPAAWDGSRWIMSLVAAGSATGGAYHTYLSTPRARH